MCVSFWVVGFLLEGRGYFPVTIFTKPSGRYQNHSPWKEVAFWSWFWKCQMLPLGIFCINCTLCLWTYRIVSLSSEDCMEDSTFNQCIWEQSKISILIRIKGFPIIILFKSDQSFYIILEKERLSLVILFLVGCTHQIFNYKYKSCGTNPLWNGLRVVLKMSPSKPGIFSDPLPFVGRQTKH